jgi:cyanophycin synthetase
MKKLNEEEIKNFKSGTRSILRAAIKNGVSIYRFFENERVFILRKGDRTIWLRGPRLSISNPVSLWIIKDKFLTKKALEEVGIPYPKGFPAKTISEAMDISKKLGFPLVMKPRRYEGGKGVFLNIDSEEKIKRFFRSCIHYDKQVLLEEEIIGKYYRITMVDNKIAGILETQGISLRGNGKNTVKELINQYNSTSAMRYKITKKTRDILSFQDSTLDSIPKAEQELILGFSGAEGGYWIDRTDSICKENVRLLGKLTRHLDLKVAGIDLIAKDISLPIDSKKSLGYVLEINGAPEFLFHHHPTQGKPRDIGAAIIKMLFNK